MLTIIAAAAENNALGKDNDLVWHLPDDFKRFKVGFYSINVYIKFWTCHTIIEKSVDTHKICPHGS